MTDSIPVAARLDGDHADRFTTLLEHAPSRSQSDVVHRAIEYYIEENPDEVPEFRSDAPEWLWARFDPIFTPSNGLDRFHWSP